MRAGIATNIAAIRIASGMDFKSLPAIWALRRAFSEGFPGSGPTLLTLGTDGEKRIRKGLSAGPFSHPQILQGIFTS